jgi:hypothetical protein
MKKYIGSGNFIEVTGYRPSFGVKSLMKSIKDSGYEVSLKRAKTGTYYLMGERCIDNELYLIEIRVSNHSKGFGKSFSPEVGTTDRSEEFYQGNVICQESFKTVKSDLLAWLKSNPDA